MGPDRIKFKDVAKKGGWMKRLLLLLVLVFVGCATVKVVKYNQVFASKAQDAKIDVYDASAPEKPYVEIGKITYVSATSSVDEEKALEQLKVKARELGADGIILKGFVESNVTTYTIPVAGSGGESSSQPKKDYVGIAIKYK